MRTRLFLFLSLVTSLHAQDGGQLFTLYCSACHGADGKGATGGTFPPLSQSPWVGGDADRAVKIALKGLTGPVDVLGKTYNLEMPPQGAVLADGQVAAILTFVRSSWGNQAGPVTADFVKTIRTSVNARNTPWTSGEILKLHPLPLEKTALTNLISQVYAGKWSSIPDFSTLKAQNVEEEQDGIITVTDSPLKDDFAMLWQADFSAPADGEYQFFLDADDSGRVIIDGKTVVEVLGAGPMDGSRSKQGKIALNHGPHKFRVEFLELSDKQGITVGWKAPGTKTWKWLSDTTAKPGKNHEPIPIEPVNGRPVIYRNFIAGTTSRAIGVGFPGGLNLAYSADDLAPELIWTGAFIDGALKWLERGTDNSPPAGENVVKLSKSRTLPNEARFKGYKLDSGGNPTFYVQIGGEFLFDSWHAEADKLIRTLTLSGNSSPLEILVSDQLAKNTNDQEYSLGDKIFLRAEHLYPEMRDGKTFLKIPAGQSATLTYRWK